MTHRDFTGAPVFALDLHKHSADRGENAAWQLQVKITVVTVPSDPKREVGGVQN